MSARWRSIIGGWVPFTVQVPADLAKPGTTFSLKVVIKGSAVPPMVDADGHPLWPIGYNLLNNSFSGIVDDVWLRAYGKVAIIDAFIKTSFRQKTLTVDYTLKNFDTAGRNAAIVAFVARGTLSGYSPVSIKSDPIALAPGESKVVSLSQPLAPPGLVDARPAQPQSSFFEAER